jgi:hypothetical protein
MSVLLLFLDGVGCGPPTDDNPAMHTPGRLFASFGERAERDSPLPAGGRALALDAHLGLPGRPQSGTGHTAILTGENAVEAIGMHRWALPNQKLRELLRSHGLFGALNRRGFRTRFLNAYRPPFFDWGEAVWDARPWRRYLSATSWANHFAGNPFYDFDDLRAGRTVAHDYTNQGFAEAGFEVPVVEPETAGRIIARTATLHDFSMHEHFITDLVGHRGDLEDAVEALVVAERFLLAVLEHIDLESHSVVMCSDHGNIEEPDHGRHTHNPALGMLFGRAAQHPSPPRDLTGIAPLVRELLGATS